MPLTRQIAYVDLSSGEITNAAIPEKMRRLYLGGRGLDAYLLYNHVKPKCDPLSPDNALTVSSGLLGGSIAPAAARTHTGAKSPLTYGFGSSNMGGFFAPELTYAGYHHLLFKGKAKKPVYLWIRDGEIEIRDAGHVWGQDTFETQKIIRQELGDEEVKVMCIGPAGENLVRYANVRTGLKNTGGRSGVGCVWGSKNLKAIAVRGTMGLPNCHPLEALEYAAAWQKQVMDTKVAQALGYDGTMFIWNVTNTTGLLRYRNFQYNKLEDWENLTIERFHEKYHVGVTGCFGCPVHCRHRWEIKEGPLAGLSGEGPEYNTQMCMGGMLNITNWETVLHGSHLVDKYGFDMAEFANIAAWAFEIYEKGIIDERDTGGQKLDWSNADELLPELLGQVAYRKGFGDLLAEGPYKALERLGKPEAEYYLLQIKGLGNMLSDERATPALALGIATSSRGCDHLRSRPAIDLYHLPEKVLEKVFDGGPMSSDFTSYVGKAREVWVMERIFAVVDSIGTCKFHTIFFSPHMPSWNEWSEMIYQITDLKLTPQELRDIGERIYTLERMFNHREAGRDRKDDALPERYFAEAVPGGLPIVKGKRMDREKFEKMLDEYYECHGWDQNGVPTREALEKLGLDKEPSHLL
jgi:aldehyde:ferredoxin oxidoreductase